LAQAAYWLLYAFGFPLEFGFARWLVSEKGSFDLARALDCVSAAAMAAAGLLVVAAGIPRVKRGRMLVVVRGAELVAVAVLLAMNGIGALAHVVFWTSFDAWLTLTLLIWFGPPFFAAILLNKIRRGVSQHAVNRPGPGAEGG
jgi:hypothetical protein